MKKLLLPILIAVLVVAAFVVGSKFAPGPVTETPQTGVEELEIENTVEPDTFDPSGEGSEIKDDFSATLKDQRGGNAEGTVLFTVDKFLSQGRYIINLKNLLPLEDNQRYEAWIQTKEGLMENLGIVAVRDDSTGFLESIGRNPGDGDNIVITLWRGVEDVGGQVVLSGRLE